LACSAAIRAGAPASLSCSSPRARRVRPISSHPDRQRQPSCCDNYPRALLAWFTSPNTMPGQLKCSPSYVPQRGAGPARGASPNAARGRVTLFEALNSKETPQGGRLSWLCRRLVLVPSGNFKARSSRMRWRSPTQRCRCRLVVFAVAMRQHWQMAHPIVCHAAIGHYPECERLQRLVCGGRAARLHRTPLLVC
jgi:hypothetical protein